MSTVLNHEQANEILARQVAEEIDTTGMAKNGMVIFEDRVMSRSEAARLVDERIIEARKSASFDLQDAITDYLPMSQARLRLRTNLLWSLSYRVIGALRDVIYRMNECARETGSIDNWNDFLAELSEAKASADYAELMGYAHFGSGINKARALLELYYQWGDACKVEAKNLRTKVDLPDLFKLIDEPPRVDPVETEKAATVARLMLEGEPTEVIEEGVKLSVAKAAADHKARVDNAKALAPHLGRMLAEAMAERVQANFDDLPLDVQQALIDAALRSAKKLPEQLVKMRSVSTMDLVTAIPALRRMGEKLECVLADPRFAD